MDDKKFVKNLTQDEQVEILKFIIDKFDFNDKQKFSDFYNSLVNYIKTVRRNVETFKRNIDEIIELFTTCRYSNDEIIEMLTKEPSLLHANKNDLFWRILILGKVHDTKNGGTIREHYLIQNPRILRISQDLMYARIKYLEGEEGKQYLRKEQKLTQRQVIKITNDEFNKTYGIDKDSLIEKYPFDKKAQLDVILWPENKELLDSIFKGKGNHI